MVDFIRSETSCVARVRNDLYLGPGGDNSDNGHWVVNLDGPCPIVSGA